MSDPTPLFTTTPMPAPFGTVSHANLHAAADLLVWVAVVGVPAILLWHARAQATPVRRLLGLLAVFAGGIGLVLALQALPAWFSRSWDGAVVAVTAAVVGWAAVAALLRQLPAVLRAVEQEARTSDLERLRLLEAAVTASGDGVMIADATEADATAPPQIVFANPAFEQLMGYTNGEAVGLSPSVFCHPESAARHVGDDPNDAAAADEAAALEAIRAAVRGSEPVRMELPSRRKDGSRVWAEWQVVPVADTAGRYTHWVAVLRDTTERRKLEEQLRESQKMDAIGRLAGGIAHDFNNLLTVIRGNAELLTEIDSPGGAAFELVDEIRGAGERAAGLVRQLLTFGRRQPARPEVVDLNAVVGDLAGMLRRLLGERIAVAARFAAEPVKARVDRGQLEQVVMNLAVNARDAMPKGGTLTITTAAATAGKGGPAARLARLTVTDTGTGMSPEVRAKIFEPFFTTKEPGKGTGLGLATVYGIVTQAGGRVGVDSTPGVGTAFRVDLPWCDEAPKSGVAFPSTVTPPPRDRLVGRGRSVLLVEDEEGVRKLARAALEGCGYAVADTPDAETALDLLATGLTADVMVTDLSMPGMGGRELAARVRESRPEMGVVFISGYAPDAGWLDGIPGAVFLPKPFTPADLQRAVGKAIARVARAAAATA